MRPTGILRGQTESGRSRAVVRGVASAGAQGCWHVGERFVGHDERVFQQLLVFIDQVGVAPAREHGDGEDFLHARLEPKESDHAARGQLDGTDAARALGLGEALGDRDAAEHGAFTNLGEPNERQAAGEVEAAGKAGHFGDRRVAGGCRVDEAERAAAGLADPEAAAVPARGVGHGEPADDYLAAGHVHQEAAVGLFFTPSGGRVGLAQRRDVAWAAIDHAQAVQVAAVGRLEGGHKRRAPPRREAGGAVERA